MRRQIMYPLHCSDKTKRALAALVVRARAGPVHGWYGGNYASGARSKGILLRTTSLVYTEQPRSCLPHMGPAFAVALLALPYSKLRTAMMHCMQYFGDRAACKAGYSKLNTAAGFKDGDGFVSCVSEPTFVRFAIVLYFYALERRAKFTNAEGCGLS